MGAKRPKRLVLITLQLITFKLLMSNKSAMILKKRLSKQKYKVINFLQTKFKITGFALKIVQINEKRNV